MAAFIIYDTVALAAAIFAVLAAPVISTSVPAKDIF